MSTTKIIDDHKPGFKGIWKIYPIKKLKKGVWLPAAFSIISSILFFYSKKDSYVILSNTIGITLSVLPNLLGFLLGGYSILIGFGNEKLLKAATIPTSDDKPSLFQLTSAIFAFSIFAQSITLIIAGMVYIISILEISIYKYEVLITPYFRLINSVAFFIISFGFIFSISLIPAMVKNIFNLAQAYHFILTKERIK